MKIKNNDKKIAVIFGILLIGILIYSNLDTLVFVPINNINEVDGTDAILLGSTDYSVQYKMTFSTDTSTITKNQASPQADSTLSEFIFYASDIDPPMGVTLNKEFFSHNILLNGIQSASDVNTGNEISRSYKIENQTASCYWRPQGSAPNGDTIPRGAVCKLSFTLIGIDENNQPVPASFWGLNSGEVIIDYLKGDYQCLGFEEKCDNLNYSKCEMGYWAEKGQVIGQCGVTENGNNNNETQGECTNGATKSCTLSIVSGTQTCINGEWTACSEKNINKGIPFYYYLIGLSLLSIIIYIFLRRNHGKRR